MCFDYTGARLDNKHLSVKHGHNHWCLFVYQGSDGRGVGQSASKGRFPQALLDCSSVESLGRGEELYLDRRCIHVSAWTTNYGEFTERGRPFRSVNVSSLLLQWDVLDGNHPPHDWKGLRSFKYLNTIPCTFQSPTSCWHKHSPWSFDQAPLRTNDICHL